MLLPSKLTVLILCSLFQNQKTETVPRSRKMSMPHNSKFPLVAIVLRTNAMNLHSKRVYIFIQFFHNQNKIFKFHSFPSPLYIKKITPLYHFLEQVHNPVSRPFFTQREKRIESYPGRGRHKGLSGGPAPAQLQTRLI